MQYKITQIFHAAFLCTDYAMYEIDRQNIFHTTQRILVNMICNIYNIHIKNTQYSNRQILEFTKHIHGMLRVSLTNISKFRKGNNLNQCLQFR